MILHKLCEGCPTPCIGCEKIKEHLETTLEMLKKEIAVKGDGSYCDTGADMDWACRSECVEKAVERLRKHYGSN